ncbi:hypothetical protein [Janthinobacterium sp. PSPC3-1]|uniref:hypothetical protein n=1 Tax=Janthinobacterium sp. PSPC3-1 TaxID=2804653 RepID=UPI003CF5E48A
MHMQKIVTLCLLLLCASTTVAATQTVLPVTLAKGIPMVQLRLDGKTVPFVLDTGAGTSLHLTPEVAIADGTGLYGETAEKHRPGR